MSLSPTIPYYLRPPGSESAPLAPPSLGEQIAAAKADQASVAAIPAPVLAMSGGGMGSAMPSLPAPAMPNVVHSQPLDNRNELSRLESTGSGISRIHNPLERGLARAGDIALSVFAPRVEKLLPGGEGRHQVLVGQQQQIVANDQATAQQEAATENVKAQTDQRTSQAAKYGAQAEDFTPFTVTREQAEAVNSPNLAGTQLTGRDYAGLLKAAGNNNTSDANNSRNNETRVTTTDMRADASTSNNAATNAARQSIADAANRTRTLVAQMHDSTSRANNQNSVAARVGGTGPDGVHKVPADVTKRAALGTNVIENANAVGELLKSHPDIVGATGGRYTTVQQMIGSDDPAIAEMGVRMHNIALASNGAHGVRAQGAIEQTENELFNHFKSGPTAINAALNATRGSMQTFLDDEHNFAQSGQRVSPINTPSNGPKVGDIHPGNDGNYRFKGGDQYDQSNWVKVDK